MLVLRTFLLWLFNYGLLVVCATITDFYVVFVEDLFVPMIFLKKMFTDKVQKLSANVCFYIHAVGQIKPNYQYVSFSVLAAVLCSVSYNYRFLAFTLHLFFVVSTLFKCTL